MVKRNRIKKTLKFSLLEGIFTSCMVGLTTDYFTPYALVLKATVRQIGALSAVPFLASSLAQLRSAEITEKFGSRRKTITVFVFLHALMLIPIMLIPHLFKTHQVLFLILFVTLFTALNTLATPVWSSLMAEYIPYKMRGRYFGWRNKIMSIIIIVFSLASGFILHFFQTSVLKGFTIIFIIAFLSRIISWYFLTRMYESPFKPDKSAYFGVLDFIKNIRSSNFVRFVLFVAGLQFCVNLASPFFSVFMLRDLKFDYITYTVTVTTVTVVQILTLGRWGRCADITGNVKVLKFTGLVIASLPLWWIISQNRPYLIFAQALSGFAWAGFNLCTGNFVYDAVTPQKRIRCIAYLSVFVGMAVFLGGIAGGYLAAMLPDLFGYKLLTLFLISSALRFLAVMTLSRKVNEVRAIHKMKSKDLALSVIGIRSIPR
ncbi:MAG: MFS transporter [Deltaproteobacteria bacterium]